MTYGLGCESDNLPGVHGADRRRLSRRQRNVSVGLPAGDLSGNVSAQRCARSRTYRPTANRQADAAGTPGPGPPLERALIPPRARATVAWRPRSPITNWRTACKPRPPNLIDLSRETRSTRELVRRRPRTDGPLWQDVPLGPAHGRARRAVRHADQQRLGRAWRTVPSSTRQMPPAIDQPIAALLTDLHRRGLLDSTLLVWTGEFGRTPVMQGNLGRDHSPYGFSIVDGRRRNSGRQSHRGDR